MPINKVIDPSIFTINDLIERKYEYSDYADLNVHLVLILRNIYERNQTLSTQELDKVLNEKLMGGTGKRRPLNYGSGCWDALELITRKHVLSDKHISSIIAMGSIDQYDWGWFENLITNGQVISDKIMSRAIKEGYLPSINTLMIKQTATIDDLNYAVKASVKNIHNLDEGYSRLKKFMEKFRIIPDSTTFTSLNIWDATDKFSRFLELLLEYKPELDNKIFVILHEICRFFTMGTNSELNKYIERYFAANIIDEQTLYHCFSSSVRNERLENIKFTIEHMPNDIINIKYINQLSHYSSYKSEKSLGNINLSGISSVKSHPEIYNFNGYNPKLYIDIIDLCLKNDYDNLTINELIKTACERDDIILFDSIIDRTSNIPEKCIEYACDSKTIFNRLIDMKCLPTIGCVDKVHAYFSSGLVLSSIGLNDLLTSGLVLNLEVIKRAFKKEIYIPDLSNFGYIPGIELYQLMGEYDIYPECYLDQLKKIPDLHMDIREYIRNPFHKKSAGKSKNIISSEDEIIKQIKLRKIIPDITMYTHAVINSSDSLVEYFEKSWGMKPNLTTFSKITASTKRLEYFNKLIELYGSIIPPEIICTKAIELVQPVPVANQEQIGNQEQGVFQDKPIKVKPSIVKKRGIKKV